jgi:branched-subunit amino acid ABC-type transport system permease component
LDVFLQQLFAGLATGSVYALVAYGYGLIFATSRIVNFAQGHLVMLGAILGVTFLNMGLPYPAMVLVTIAAVAGAGIVLERTVTLPLRAVRSPYTWIVATLAAAVIIENLVGLTYGTSAKKFPQAFTGEAHFGKVVIGYHNLLVLLVAVGMMALIEVFLAKTYAGKAIRATADNPVGARLSGVPVPRLVTLSFALAGAIAGLAGVLVGPITTAFVAVGLLLGLKGFIAAVIGGLGSFRGALIGGLILGLTENVVEQQLPNGVAGAILLGMLLLTLVLRPQGLFGRQQA